MTHSSSHWFSCARKRLESNTMSLLPGRFRRSSQCSYWVLPSIVDIYAKSKEGKPQRMLLERRIKALKLVVQTIDDLSNK